MLTITGGAGFIGFNFVSSGVPNEPNLVLDALTYAAAAYPALVRAQEQEGGPRFVRSDLRDVEATWECLRDERPSAVVHFAAETHVDRSIKDPAVFVDTNVRGTLSILESCLRLWRALPAAEQENFRFIHVSTDEVYGSLAPDAAPFTESHPYQPNSPYAASKAASDHLVRAYFHTYGLPVITTNCSNNYGPYQFPEKLIPLCIHNALAGKPLPIYGDGQQIRDWLYVGDHCMAIRRVLEAGRPGETYNIGGWNEKTNLEVVQTLCAILDEERPRGDGRSYAEQITFVKDRPGHDRRYAIDARKIERELGWRPVETFDTGIRKTVRWYLENQDWVSSVTSGSYRDWIEAQYGESTAPQV